MRWIWGRIVKAADGAMPLVLQGFSIVRMIFYTAPSAGTRVALFSRTIPCSRTGI